MGKNIKISDEAYEWISKHSGKTDQSLTKAVDDLLGLTNVQAPDDLAKMIRIIIQEFNVAKWEDKELTVENIDNPQKIEPVSRRIIVEQVKTHYELNPSIAPGWVALSSIVKSKFYNDIDNALKKLLKDEAIEKVATGKYIWK